MSRNSNYPDWFLWIYEKGIYLFIAAAVIFITMLVAVFVDVGNRLGHIEEQLEHKSPTTFSPVDLKKLRPVALDTTQLKGENWIYVPVYSHVYYHGGAPFPLEATLSIRNIHANQSVFIRKVDYYDTDGVLVKSHLDEFIELKPLQTIEFLVESRDHSGGSGANFLVQWQSTGDQTPPLVEAVMVGVVGTHAISFTKRGIAVPK